MANIELKNVSKTFGENKVVKNINIAVPYGEFLALLGPSGCGKSTILRMIAGLETIDEGVVTIAGQKVNDIAPKNRDIAMVFQNYALYPHMNVYDNLAFALKMKGVEKDEIDKTVRRTADLLDITELLDRKPKQLSGGQKQRIALGRAIVRDPEAFLFDEPLSNLDAKLRVKMRTDLLKLHKSQNATSIYVTHDQVEAMTMADRVVILNKGVIQQVDAPLQVYKNPSNLFVASFIGSPSMNFIKGHIKNRNSSTVFENTSGTISFKLPEQVLNSLSSHDPDNVTLGIRPEDLTIKASEATLPLQSVSIKLIEHMGDVSYIYCNLETDNEWTVKIPPKESLQSGQNIDLHFKAENIHLFDGETEKNLREH